MLSYPISFSFQIIFSLPSHLFCRFHSSYNLWKRQSIHVCNTCICAYWGGNIKRSSLSLSFYGNFFYSFCSTHFLFVPLFLRWAWSHYNVTGTLSYTANPKVLLLSYLCDTEWRALSICRVCQEIVCESLFFPPTLRLLESALVRRSLGLTLSVQLSSSNAGVTLTLISLKGWTKKSMRNSTDYIQGSFSFYS